MNARTLFTMSLATVFTLFGAYSPLIARAQVTSTINWHSVDQAMGKTGTLQPDNVHRYSMPRSDLKIRIGSLLLKPGFALGSHVEFMQMGTNEAMAMGDLVLTEKEVGPVMTKLAQSGIDIMALHNHLISETPKVMYMHIGAHGNPVSIASAIHAALRLTKTPMSTKAKAPAKQGVIALDTKSIDAAMGRSGTANNDIYQFSIPRAGKITDQGVTIPPAMGVATAINFQPLRKGNAAITGDFVLTGQEVDPVIASLTSDRIQVTALHSHSLTENPRLFYLHFYATGSAVGLAKSLRSAIDRTNSQ